MSIHRWDCRGCAHYHTRYNNRANNYCEHCIRNSELTDNYEQEVAVDTALEDKML